MNEKIKEGILQRITSPWFFTFIPWWVVFNYDFLILVFGKVETLNAVRTYYKCSGLNERLSIFGCIDFYEWWNNQFFWKLLFPILATVVSMTIITKMISYFNEKFSYYSLSMHERQIKREKELQQIDSYTSRLSTLNQELYNTIQATYEEKRLHKQSGETFPVEVLLDRIDIVKDKQRDVLRTLEDFMFVRRYLFGMQNISVRHILHKFWNKFKEKYKNLLHSSKQTK